MGKKRKVHYRHLIHWCREYSDSRSVDFNRFSEYHMRLTDGWLNQIDIWTTGKYYVKNTDYMSMGSDASERTFEKGVVPKRKQKMFVEWLDSFFFPFPPEEVLDG